MMTPGLPRLRPVIESLISAQRSLTRALVAKDPVDREISLLERDRAALAIEQAFSAIETAYQLASRERIRMESRTVNFAAVITAIDEDHPGFVKAAVERTGLTLEDDPRMSEAFLTRLNEAVELGYASRRDGHVRITYAGIAELLRANERRNELETTKTKLFEAERRIHVQEQLLSRIEPTVTSQPISGRRAAGGS